MTRIEHILPYELPAGPKQQLLTLAAESDLLLIGETHGIQEVPGLMLSLLPALAELGYSGLALEMPTNQRDLLLQCVQGNATPPPMFGPSDFRDGRGNVQALSLIQQAVSQDWELLCFDVVSRNDGDAWAKRDREMAQNLLEQWQQFCFDRKVLGVCGSYHSRLVPPQESTDLWPSFAYSVQQAQPNLRVNSVAVKFRRGAFFNGEVRTFDNGPEYAVVQAEIRPTGWAGHTLDLHLPSATSVTFLEDELLNQEWT